MSKILNRPMFRGGGKVSSYGTGIASGLADGGMASKRGLVDGPGGYAGEQFGGFVNKVPQSPYSGGQATTGGSIMNRLRNIPYLGRAIPAAGGMLAKTSPYTAAAAGGIGIGQLADFYAKSTSTPEGYRRLREMGGANFNFDETNPDVGEIFDYIDKGNDIGEKPGFFPRGGKAKFYEERGYLPDGTKIKVEEELKSDGKTDTERRLEMEKNALKELLDSFGGSKKEDTEDEALAAIEKKQKLLEKVMGGGKSARIADASDMALNFASKALGEEATVKSSFADFFADESKRPSRSQKVKDAAANAAIQAYLTEKISEKDFSKQMALITGQAQIKQKFADAAKSNLTVQDYVTARGASVSKSEAIENGARGMVENNDQYKSFEKIDSKDNVPELLVEENIGVVFLDSKTKEVFVVTVLEDGTVGKKVLYN